MSTANATGLVGAIRIDLKRLHETWMELVYPRQRNADQTVLGKYKPDSTGGRIAYNLWSAIGFPAIALLYPFVLFGYFLRFQARRLDNAAARMGIAGVVVLSVVVWGALTALAEFQLDMFSGGVIAVLAAGIVATVAAVLAVVTSRIGGRGTTVLISYPFAITALFLPPVVAALYSESLGSVILPQSYSLAEWLLDNVLTIGGINEYLRRSYDLRGFAYVGMWFGLAVPVGWILGLIVSLANYVRPSE